MVREIEGIAVKDGTALKFDIPYHDLAFYGNTGKAMVKIVPSVNCIINITDIPFFILEVADIEMAHFERVGFALRNFDIAFVHRDLASVTKIGSIESKELENIKKIVDFYNILYTEGPVNLNWPNVLSSILTEFESFLADGAWRALEKTKNEEEQEEEEAKEREDDADYQAEEAYSEGSSEDDTEDENASDEDQNVEEDLDEDEEAEDWDAMDKRVEHEERE